MLRFLTFPRLPEIFFVVVLFLAQQTEVSCKTNKDAEVIQSFKWNGNGSVQTDV